MKKIKVSKNGPYEVTGQVPLKHKEIVDDGHGGSLDYRETETFPAQETYRLCRCGHSKNKPYCDGSHLRVKFDGTETAEKATYSEMVEQVVDGEGIELLDATSLCAVGRFCHPGGGTWQMAAEAKSEEEKAAAIGQACRCCSGRLTVRDKKTGKLLEPDLPEEINVTEDAPMGKMGPLYVTGGVEIEDGEGEKYPKRNRVTLCRCGRSRNKPFCDGSHDD